MEGCSELPGVLCQAEQVSVAYLDKQGEAAGHDEPVGVLGRLGGLV